MNEIYVSNFKIRQLWREFSRKRFAIPEIQREFVWDAFQREAGIRLFRKD